MATLRDPLFNADLNLSPQKQQELEASGMGSLRRGFEAGRIGTEVNPLQTEALQAEIDGDMPRAEALKVQIAALQQRQAMYAPQVGRVEDINGVGDGLSWAAGQVGQGAASMMDPIAVSAGLGAVGRAARFIPGPIGQGVSKLAQGAGLAIPYMMSKGQLRGEQIGSMREDETLMGMTTPQQRMDSADSYSTLAAIPDSAFPGLVGRQLSGVSRAAGATARQGMAGPGLRTLGAMGLEGGTEAAQSFGAQFAQGLLNPDRDTSGDFMENVNSFAGGAVGSGPLAAAGAYAQAGHNRIGDGVDRVKDAAGSVVDMMNESPTVQAGVAAVGKAKDSVVDLFKDDDGVASAAALMENLKAGAQDIKSAGQSAMDDYSTLSGQPPDDILQDNAKMAKWFAENDPKRAQLVSDKLSDMADDADAQKHLEAINNPDPVAQSAAIEDAAQFLLGKTTMGRAEERAASLGENLGKIAGVVGPAIGKGAVATGKAAVRFGKSMLSGAKDGMAKKNEQATAAGPESFMSWRDRVYGVNGSQAAADVLASADPVVTQRGDLAGNYATDMATRLNPRSTTLPKLASHAAFTLTEMVSQAKAKGMGSQNIKLNRLVDDLHGVFKTETSEVVQQLGSIIGPKAAPLIDYMTTELAKRSGPQGRATLAAERDALARQLVSLIDPVKQNELLAQGVNLNTPRGREQALHLFEDYADGISSASGVRKALDRTFGPESVASAMELLNGVAEKKEKLSPGPVVDDRKQTGVGSNGESNLDDEELSGFDVRAAEKTATKGTGPKVYGFHATANLRTSSERRDMFGPTDASTDEAVKRPSLFTKGQQLFGGKGDAIEKKIADVKAQLADDPEYPDHDNHSVTAKSAHEVMKEAGMQPGKMLQLYRDYMRMDAADERLPEGQRKYAQQQAKAAHGMILDAINKRDADGKLQKFVFKTGPGERAEMTQAAEAYFKERYVVVGEQLSNRDPSKISVPEMLDMHKEGAGLIERTRLTDEPMQALSDANVLMFKSSAVKGGEVAIPAGKLVNWVRQQRGKSEASSAEDTDGSRSNRSKNEEYLNDVSEGIASLIGSGHVKGMPYKVNKFGKTESFSQGVPESLRLATQTYGDMKFGEEKRRSKLPRKADAELATVGTPGYDAKVGREQTRERSDETEGSIDDVPEGEGMKRRIVNDALTPTERAELNKLPTLAARQTYIKSLTKGMGVAEAAEFLKDLELTGSVGAAFNPDAKTSKTDDRSATPLDFFGKAEGVPDEYADQRYLSRQTGASTDNVAGPEPKGTAASSAGFRAQAITDAFLSDPAKGQEMVKMRVRMALAPEYSEAGKDAPGKDQVVGGVHYIAPVAAFINAANLADNNIDLAAPAIAAIRSKVANILLKGAVSKTEKVKIARLMFEGEEKVTAMNVDALLGRTAAGTATGKPIVAKTEPAAPEVASAGLPKGRLTLSGGSERKLNAQSSDADNDARAKLITRLADDRRDEFLHASKTDVISRKLGTDTFGPLGREFTHYFATDGDSTHAFIVPNQFLARLDAELNRRTESGSQLKALAFFAVQHAMYDTVSGDFATFGPRIKTPAADLLESMGALGDTGQQLYGNDPMTRVEGVSGRETMRFLASALAYTKHVTGEDTVPVSWERVSGGSIGKIGGGMFNAQEESGPSKVASQDDMEQAKAYAMKVLGPKIKVLFKDITGYSGEFIDAQNAIEISTTAAAGTMNTLYHEAMHVFFRDFVKGNPKMQAVFESLINDPKHIQKLHSLLDGFPAAQAQLTSGEERLAYTYQFWKAGLLQVDATAHTWLQKVGKFFRKVLGMVRDSERALELFIAFDQGKMSEPSAAGQVIAKALGAGTNAMKLRRQMDGMLQGLAALTIPAAEILGNSVSPTARKLSTMMFTNPGEEAHGSEETGMMNARRNVSQQYINVANRKFETMSEVDKKAVQKYLQSATDPATIPSKEQREAVADTRNLLDRFHKYMTDAGLEVGKVENYYPVVWNPDLLNANKGEFISMLVSKYAQQMNPNGGNAQKSAERIWQSLVNKEGVDAHLPVGREDGVLSPFFASQEQRTLPWLDAADREKYLDKNMPLTLTRYFNQGAHATEYHRRFGKDGIKLEKMLLAVRTELSGASKEMMKRGEIKDEPARVKWVSRQMRDVSQSVGAMEGALGKDISPNMRKFNSWMAVYQNIRVLPMALFSSFVDPLAMVARGAPWQAAYETFAYSMREVFRGWADVFKDMPPERAKDEWRQLAEFIGASEIAMFQHHVSDEYSSTYMTPGAKKLNDKMFVFNGMEAWNRGNRIMATKWGVRFIEKHVTNADPIHSMRWLKELGLTPDMITMDEGKLVTSPQQLSVLKGISLDEARAQIAPIHDALNRFVEGAVLTPNAAQRPAWSSDPNYASMFHLKQFSYSFHQTILKRATNEFNHGNMAPLGALATFIPTMIGADLIKGLIQGAGTLPPYMASMNAGDWLMHGAQRAGLSGIGTIGMDAATDWASLGGPAFEQIIDAGRDGFGSKSALNAMPLHSLYGTMLTRSGVSEV